MKRRKLKDGKFEGRGGKNSKRRKVGKTKNRKDNHVKMTIKSKRLNVGKKERRNVGKRIVGKTGLKRAYIRAPCASGLGSCS